MNKKTLKAIYGRTGGLCAYCGKELEPYGDWQVDHVIPKSKGGKDDISNYLPSCARCNRMKHSKYLEDWRFSIFEKIYGQVCRSLLDIQKHKQFIINYPKLEEKIFKAYVEYHNAVAEIEISFMCDDISGDWND